MQPASVSEIFLSSRRLSPPRGLNKTLRRAVNAVLKTQREDLSPMEMWVEDHARFLLEEADALGRALRGGPRLPGDRTGSRIMALSRMIVRNGGGEVNAPLILRTVRENLPEDQELTQDELCRLPSAITAALFEMLMPLLTTCLEEKKNRRLAEKYAKLLLSGGAENVPQGLLLREKIITLLAEQERAEGLRQLDALLKQSGETAEQTAVEAHQEMTRQGQEAEKIILSLRNLKRMPFDSIIERLSPVARILREEETYRRMDKESRGYYIGRVCHIARRLHVRETAVARTAMALCREQSGERSQAGYYLIERADLIAARLLKRKAGKSEMRKEWAYLACLAFISLCVLSLCAAFRISWYLWPLILLCFSEIARLILHPMLLRRFPPRMVPRLQPEALADSLRVLIVVPTLLTSKKQALRMARQLSVLRAATPDERFDFMLLGDFADASSKSTPQDEEILSAATAAIEALNRQQGGGFLYFQRARALDEKQKRWTGRERKRGALEMLNMLIAGHSCPDSILFSTCAPASLAGRYDYVITLDADTFLPPGAALQLLGAMEHPLQKGRLTLLQPRMETAADTVRTRAQKYLGGRGGVDPYHMGRQELYQDLFGKGSFVGKGIYAPVPFLAAEKGRIPAGRILSHDLLEGEMAGCALANDICFYDGHPARLSGWQKRLHRWTRGDWQLLPFLLDRSLSPLSRHKIRDNLRRSLLPIGRVLLLILSAIQGRPLLFLLALPWPIRGMGLRLLLLPADAVTLLDAIARALYRQFVSGRDLLAWVTAAQAEGGSNWPLSCVLSQAVLGAGLTILSLLPGGFLPAAAVGILWLTMPLLTRFFDGSVDKEPQLTESQKDTVRDLGRRTWRFFEMNVGEKTHFLPPDNVQIDPDKGAAMRTSPTNMGLYLLSCCAARELSFITTAEMAKRLHDALDTLEKLPRWHGHLYNWYDLDTLAPLPPRFVSTVDSGNFAGCLMGCAQLCRSRLAEMEEQFQDLPARLDALAAACDFARLYDAQAELFAIGFDAEAGKLTPAHYDLMASEARLTSYIAIMMGQAPLRHWRRLNRSVTRAGGGPALLSWGGTMFEYLLPTLLLPMTNGTLLGEGCLSAVRAQMAAAGNRPFGISECGYYAFDPDLNYQYRAFGLPALALSGETAGQVIAPYASMLALPFFPQAAARNLKDMQRLKWQDEQGLFEAADYSPQRVEKSPRLIMSHMAHHQGMILCAICNALTDFSLVRAFMTPARAQAYSYLLCEYAPARPRRRIPLPAPRQDAPTHLAPARAAMPGLPLDACVLSGGGMTWVIAANGQGYLSKDGMMLSRFLPEAGEQTGPQLYLRNPTDGTFCRPMAEDEAIFGAGCASFSGAHFGIKSSVRCCVAPLAAVAVCTLELENPGKTDREIEAISFLEIAQSGQKADQEHPNFRDLSVRVEEFGQSGLLSRRLNRDEKDCFPFIVHTVTGDIAALRRQGDRRLFLGRTGTYAAPGQLLMAAGDAQTRLGDVIAPCLSLRVRMRVPAGGKSEIRFMTAARAEDDAHTPLMSDSLKSVLHLAATQERMTLRFLQIDGRALSLYRQMLGAILFTGQPHQASLPPAPVSCLWQGGVSGDLPILTLRIGSQEDKALIRHALRFHAWARTSGVWLDLIFLLPREDAYARPLRDMTASLIAVSPSRDLMGINGGVHLIAGDENQLQQVESRARLTLRGGLSLHRQLSLLRFSPPAFSDVRMENPLPILPPPLTQFNGFGGFTKDGAYCVTAPAPAPWHNILTGRRFGTIVCENGILTSFGENSRLNRVTRPCPDPHRGLPSEEILMRLGDALYPLAACTARHEPGVTSYSVRCGDVYAECAVFSHAELPLGVRMLTFRSEKAQSFRIHHIVRFSLGADAECTRCQADNGFVFARCGDVHGIAFSAMTDGAGKALSPSVCFGLSGNRMYPGLTPSAHGPGSVGLLTGDVTLRPHEGFTLVMTLGCAADEKEALALFAQLLHQGAKDALRQVRARWDDPLSRAVLYGGDRPLEHMLNRWLPYQAVASRLMARTGPYQPGGAYGFRDQLQDLLALMYTDPDLAKRHILLCAAHQYEEGDVQHWWHAPRHGVRTRISDDKLFLPYLTALYVDITGDEGILNVAAPYLKSPALSEDESDRYEEPQVSAMEEPLLLHCLRAIDSVRLGRHDLPLMGGGDWNDGMNRIGGRQGESVWLGFFLILVIKRFSPFCSQEDKQRLAALRRKLLDGTEQAWTGKWYLRAWQDTGEPLGGPDTRPPRIDLISQAFAVLAGAPRDHAREALFHAVDQLYDRRAGMVKLLWPPFTPDENAGYIGAYLPGIRENGGQYTHAVPWLILALCHMGEYQMAWEIAKAILPCAHGDTMGKVSVYQVEPYVLAGDVYAGENLGRGGWTWYTGSAAWLYYTLLTGLLGFEKHGNKAKLTPHKETGLEEYTLLYRFGQATYHFTAAIDAAFPTLDGEKLRDGWATLTDDGKTHEARYPIR